MEEAQLAKIKRRLGIDPSDNYENDLLTDLVKDAESYFKGLTLSLIHIFEECIDIAEVAYVDFEKCQICLKAHGAQIPRRILTTLGSLYGVEKALIRNRRRSDENHINTF